VTAVNWKSRVNGDWNVAANWSVNTVPTLVNAISISTSRAYIAKISNFDLANYVTFNGSGRAVGKWGSLTMAGAFTVDSGLVPLNEVNTSVSE
jgi:hypothetical protein